MFTSILYCYTFALELLKDALSSFHDCDHKLRGEGGDPKLEPLRRAYSQIQMRRVGEELNEPSFKCVRDSIILSCVGTLLELTHNCAFAEQRPKIWREENQ